MKNKKITRKISQGMYVLTTKNGGCIVDAVMQASGGDNPLIAVAVMQKNYTNELLKRNDKFALSVLGMDVNSEIIKTFGFNSMRDINKFENTKVTEVEGVNVIDDALGYMVCEVVDTIENDKIKDRNMAKQTSVFFCQECGYESSKWLGQCPGCKSWNSFVEEPVRRQSAAGSGKRGAGGNAKTRPLRLEEISTGQEERFTTHMPELDRVLGGGIVRGSLVLVGGDPGIGKSTLLLQVCRMLAMDERKVLYVSGEESLKQIKLRADRLGTFGDSLSLFCETNLDIIEETIGEFKPQVVVIDSI